MNGRDLVFLGAGFTVWASAFVALYAMLSVGCRFGWDGVELFADLSLQRVQLVVILIVHLAAGGVLVAMLRADTVAFLRRTAYLAAVAALLSSVFSFAAVFWLSPCA